MSLDDVEKLLAKKSVSAIKAKINLDDPNEALVLEMPGLFPVGRTNKFTLAQSSEAIISILCKEIPYVISDLLSVISKSVFHKVIFYGKMVFLDFIISCLVGKLLAARNFTL